MPLAASLASVTLALSALVTPGSSPAAIPSAAPAQEGMSFVGWDREAYDGLQAERSMENLAATGAEWVSIVVTRYQATYRSTEIVATGRTPSDAGVVHMIDTAHALGLSVMLKPHLDLSNDPSHWRGDIGDGFGPVRRAAWFDAYRAFVLHYASIAARHGVEQFSVGCELEGMTGRARAWRDIVRAVRSEFAGTLTYAAWPGEEHRITWWRAVDLIGVDAYYPLTDRLDPSVAQLIAGWAPREEQLAYLSSAFGRPVLLTEIGYVSQDGTNRIPYSWKVGDLDLQEQADCYRAAFDALWNEPWLAGAFWWNWNANPNVGGPTNTGFPPFGKPAEDVLRSVY